MYFVFLTQLVLIVQYFHFLNYLFLTYLMYFIVNYEYNYPSFNKLNIHTSIMGIIRRNFRYFNFVVVEIYFIFI